MTGYSRNALNLISTFLFNTVHILNSYSNIQIPQTVMSPYLTEFCRVLMGTDNTCITQLSMYNFCFQNMNVILFKDLEKTEKRLLDITARNERRLKHITDRNERCANRGER